MNIDLEGPDKCMYQELKKILKNTSESKQWYEMKKYKFHYQKLNIKRKNMKFI